MSGAFSRDDRRLRPSSLERSWGRLRVWQVGAGPPLLLIHGLGGSGRYWQAVAGALADQYHVIAPDLAGFGGSTKGAGRYERQAHLDDLDAAVHELAPEDRIVVAGHSLGGVLAALWAGRARGRVAALAVIAAPYPGTGAVAGPPPGSQAAAGGLRRAARRGLSGAVRLTLPVVALPVGLASGYPPGLVVDFALQDPASRRGTMRSLLSEPAVAGELAALRGLDGEAPVLLVAARDDRLVPPAALQRWSTLLPQAETHLLDAGGHQLLFHGGGDLVVRWLQNVRSLREPPRVVS
jgi:pimeloyl-ACP methyl ester carboxylesterase